jgi:hypothetical protein
MAIAIVQTKAFGGDNSSGVITIQPDSNLTAGTALVIFIATRNSVDVLSFVDDQSQVWTQKVDFVGGLDAHAYIYTCPTSAPGTRPTLTITLTNNGFNWRNAILIEIAGVDTSNILDVHAEDNQFTASDPATSTANVTLPDSLGLSYTHLLGGTGIDPDSAFTLIINDASVLEQELDYQTLAPTQGAPFVARAVTSTNQWVSMAAVISPIYVPPTNPSILFLRR